MASLGLDPNVKIKLNTKTERFKQEIRIKANSHIKFYGKEQ